jgi:hypothetical protein
LLTRDRYTRTDTISRDTCPLVGDSLYPVRAMLVRIGIDQAYGDWNAPVDPESNEFVYVPIPEGVKAPQHPTWRRRTQLSNPRFTRSLRLVHT